MRGKRAVVSGVELGEAIGLELRGNVAGVQIGRAACRGLVSSSV